MSDIQRAVEHMAKLDDLEGFTVFVEHEDWSAHMGTYETEEKADKEAKKIMKRRDDVNATVVKWS